MTSWGEGTKRKTCPVHIPENLHRAFKAVCARQGRKMGEVVNEIVSRWIAEQEQKERKELGR